ncbi:MAG: PilT/PilU family type 4a pilus ATPase [Candidatus Omnitrophica bacterium]|jgi:twitching motility protein PilT|nr:PilT/PilU family type 4a pilus ATPase [Candidatus Omnitrophota bacterium]
MNFKEILDIMIDNNVSDIFIRANANLKGRIYSHIEVIREEIFTVESIDKIVNEIAKEYERESLKSHKACEFTYWYKDTWRFRIGIFYQRNTAALVVRKIDLRIPKFQDLNLPSPVLEKFCYESRGIILLTGITGSGKSTTIASMIQYINDNLGRHILTIEEPIEFTFKDNKSVINQREIGRDVKSYEDALRQFAVHSPDVIYIGNIRDAQTCHAALTAAETGVLVFSTLHTVNATSTIERMVNFFPPHQQNFVTNQLSFLLKGVLSQRLLPRIDRAGLIPAYEAMVLSPSISRLMRENKPWEIPKYISSGDVYGMRTFHQCLLGLVESKKVSSQIALRYADKKEELEMELRNRGLL